MCNSPKILTATRWTRVISLTLFLLGCFSGCSWISRNTYESVGEECKTRAYIDNRLPEFITQRFGQQSQARLGVIPFTVPANFSGWGPQKPDWGYELATRIHQELLATAEMPVVEVLDRRDWPGKAEEFFAGNFGAIHAARDAGYDLVFVGMLEPLRSSNSLSVVTKIIETESGITVWYGNTTVYSYRPEIERSVAYLNLSTRRPDLVYTPEMAAEMARCLAHGITTDPHAPKESWKLF